MTNSAKAVEAMRAGTETAMTTCVESIDRQENYQLGITASRATTKWRLIQRTRSPHWQKPIPIDFRRVARQGHVTCRALQKYLCTLAFLRSQLCPFSRFIKIDPRSPAVLSWRLPRCKLQVPCAATSLITCLRLAFLRLSCGGSSAHLLQSP
jgi:hypothetical protein